jgi:hypothetical protein
MLLSSTYLWIVTCTPSPASRSPGCSLWCTPVNIVTRTCVSSDSPGLHHLPDYLPYIFHSLWFLPQALWFLFQCHACAAFMFGVMLRLFIKTLTHSLNLLSRLSAHTLHGYWIVYCRYNCVSNIDLNDASRDFRL